jgi:hypothetical protein
MMFRFCSGTMRERLTSRSASLSSYMADSAAGAGFTRNYLNLKVYRLLL